MAIEPALAFFLDLVEASGGAHERDGERFLVLVPEPLSSELGLGEELSVTDAPDLAREDGSLLVISGQQVIRSAADRLLGKGVAGWVHLDWPAALPPTRERLEGAVREVLSVEHGRVDLAGPPAARYVPVLRVDALVEYRPASDQRVEEQRQVVLDATSGLPLSSPAGLAIATATAEPGRGTGTAAVPSDLLAALSGADRLLREQATARQSELVRENRQVLLAEQRRVDAYYTGMLETLERRRKGTEDSAAGPQLAREEATRAEWARRRAEVEEKYVGAFSVRPFLAVVLDVPALVVPLAIRRGARTFAYSATWLLSASSFAPFACPACGALQPLVAGREALGCRACLLAALSPVPAGDQEVRPAHPDNSAQSGNPAHSDSPAVASNPAHPDSPARPGRPGRAGRRDAAEAPSLPGAEPRGVKGPAPALVPVALEGGRALELSEAELERLMRRVEATWWQTVEDFWQSVVFAERPAHLAAHSPILALYRLFGPFAPLCGIGLASVARIRSLRGFDAEADRFGRVVGTGTVVSSRGAVPFALRWRQIGKNPSLIEVLPARSVLGLALPPRAGLSSLVVERLYREAPEPELSDPVGQALWRSVADDGLPLIVRAFALYWRAQGNRRLAGLSPNALAAGAIVLARRASATRALGLEVLAARYGLAASTLREAASQLEHVLGASATRSW